MNTETVESNFKMAQDFCQVIDKKNLGMVPKENFEKVLKMAGFMEGDSTPEHEQMFSDLITKFTI